MRRCRFYLHGRPNQFLTDLYNALEHRNPNITMIHDILKEYDVIQQYNGKMFIYQGEDILILLIMNIKDKLEIDLDVKIMKNILLR